MLSRGYFWIHILVHFDILGWPPQELFKLITNHNNFKKIANVVFFILLLLKCGKDNFLCYIVDLLGTSKMYYVNYIKNKEFCYCGVYANPPPNRPPDSKYNLPHSNLEIGEAE